ncbi:hypothetical protein [Enterococcus sp. AZ072]|uniref:hypothetical protein n=1 Tax=Enterococcus sp. AZ072 TaxID=2774640 RepID=UPI003D2E0C89
MKNLENIEKHLRKAKTWNMVLLVLGLISLIITLFGLPETLNPTKKTYDALGSYGAQMYEYLNGPMAKAIAIIGLLISIGLLVCYFMANKKLKEGKSPSKIPYYAKLAWTVISLIIGFIAVPSGEYMGVDMSRFTQISSIVSSIIISIPVILVIVHLFKAEPEE